MELVKVEGIVVKETPYKDSSKILQILTKEYGLISVIAKGCRSIKSKFRTSTTKLSLATFHINYKEGGLSTLRDVDNNIFLLNIFKSIEYITYASYLVELATQITKENNTQEVFTLLKTGLIKINDGLDPSLITSIIELKYLSLLGVSPNINACSICGNKTSIETISVDNGGLLCTSCKSDEKLYKKRTVELIRMFILVDLTKVTKLNITLESKKEIEEFIELYYDKYTGLYLNSKKLIKNLKKVGKVV